MKKRALYFWITLFSVAMGLFECIVVIYLRRIYYPEGFGFPLKMMEPAMIGIELMREAATVVMLVAIGILAGRTFAEKFGWFIYSFAIWDIFYYLFLKWLIQWPESLFTWDILFLIPTTWVGPVLAPLINSLTMILLAWLLIRKSGKWNIFIIKPVEWLLLIAGSLVVIVSYTIEYTHFITSTFSFGALLNPLKQSEILAFAGKYIPVRFSWEIFIPGVILHMIAVVFIARRQGAE